jgi:hypothetical protein
MLAALTLSKKPHHNATGFDHANHSKLIGNPALVIKLPQSCYSTDTKCGVCGEALPANNAAEIGLCVRQLEAGGLPDRGSARGSTVTAAVEALNSRWIATPPNSANMISVAATCRGCAFEEFSAASLPERFHFGEAA